LPKIGQYAPDFRQKGRQFRNYLPIISLGGRLGKRALKSSKMVCAPGTPAFAAPFM